MEVKIRDIRKYEEAKARFKHLYRRSGTDIDIIERLRYAKILDEVPGNAGRILDLGCGDGYLSLKCAANPEAEVYSIDISINQLYKFKSRIHSGNIIQIQGSVEHLPFKYDKFDLIIASEIIEHLYD
ncbi:MAG: class I SAM-dependent methyltransferase, partial [Fidelibacterota bacterium]